MSTLTKSLCVSLCEFAIYAFFSFVAKTKKKKQCGWKCGEVSIWINALFWFLLWNIILSLSVKANLKCLRNTILCQCELFLNLPKIISSDHRSLSFHLSILSMAIIVYLLNLVVHVSWLCGIPPDKTWCLCGLILIMLPFLW